LTRMGPLSREKAFRLGSKKRRMRRSVYARLENK
jgi:hypothetical protein